MRPAFYDKPSYRQKQSEISRKNWLKGKFDSLRKPLETRACLNPKCIVTFQIKSYDPKKFCSHSCSASIGNNGRIQSLETRSKIAEALKFYPNHMKGIQRVTRITIFCQNLRCNKEIKILPYLAKIRKFCSNACAMKVIGGRTTSPKASKGKPGIRLDIDPNICFYSTWEANIARVFKLLHIEWQYAPTIFDLGQHTYRPDFYLPNDDKYIEVKNFMGNYSKERDRLFRKKYPQIQLNILSKKEYQQIKEQYQPLIDNWE